VWAARDVDAQLVESNARSCGSTRGVDNNCFRAEKALARTNTSLYSRPTYNSPARAARTEIAI